jgi:hypothetical protein
MLFFNEHRMKLYACQNAWDDDAKVVQILTHKHVDGEQYDTAYTPADMRYLADHEEMKDIDKEIVVQDVSYRLDLGGMRIKHLAQASKTTTTNSGKARKGQLSWQTFKKFEVLGDLAFAWFELGGMLWNKFPAYTYKASPAADGWTCPECGAVNDANSGECDCGTTYDGEIETMSGEPGPGIQESGETVEGELLPPVKVKADAVAVVAPDAYAVRVGQLHEAAQQYANASVLCAAIAGAVMHQKKKSVKHGEFGDWIEALADEVGISRRTCTSYMALADEMAARLKELPKGKRVSFLGAELEDGATKRPILQLLADLNPADLGSEQALLVADAVRDVTNDQTLRQLYFDWGIMKDKSGTRTGGDMEVQAWLKEHYPKLAGTKLNALPASIRAEFVAYRESRKPTEAVTLAGQREDARRWWERQRLYLVEIGKVGSEVPTWGLLPDQDLLQTMVLLERTAQAMKRVLNERGAR